MEEYLKIYNDCCNKNYYDSKLEPLLDYLYYLVNMHNNCFNDANNDEEAIIAHNYERMSYIKELLTIFNKMIDNNNYDNINEIILFYNNSDLKWVQLYEYLSTIYNKEEFHKTDNFDYHFMIVDLCKQMRAGQIKGEYEYSLFKMLSCYKKYNDIIDNNPNRPKGITRFFDRFAPRVISYFYLYDYNIEYLDNLFADFVNDYNKYSSYFELNGVNEINRFVMIQPRETELVKTIVNNIVNNKRNIN